MPRGKDTHAGPKKDRMARLSRPTHHDTYARKAKHPRTFVCTGCGVMQHGGKWSWQVPSETDTEDGLCPACERIRDKYPAGTLRLPRRLVEQAAGAAEIIGLIRNVEQAESAEHPLERVIAIEEDEEGLLVTTTGLHIARRLANKLERRFHEKPRMNYAEDQHFVRVEWEP